ncbi:hypothetical protein A9W97_18875 [Mycobacterium gordonae]|nr:hypothetical protein A9W97_18875 [Mycobacterium gordonae]
MRWRSLIEGVLDVRLSRRRYGGQRIAVGQVGQLHPPAARHVEGEGAVGVVRPRTVRVIVLVEDGAEQVAVLKDLVVLLAVTVGNHVRVGISPVADQGPQVVPDHRSGRRVVHQVDGQGDLDVTHGVAFGGHRRVAVLPVPAAAEFAAEGLGRRVRGRRAEKGCRGGQ